MKKLLTILLTIAVAFSVIADIIWLGIWVYEQRVTNESTIYVGEFGSTTITEDDKAVLNINYYANKDKTGCEVLEIKFNRYTGVDKNIIFGYGVQYVFPKFYSNSIRDEKWFWWDDDTITYYYANGSRFTTYYNYSNNLNYVAIKDNIIDKNFSILFDNGEKDEEKKVLYRMQFKGEVKGERYYEYGLKHVVPSTDYNLNYFSHIIYKGVSGFSGKSGFYNFQTLFDVSSCFNFEEQRNGNFESITNNSFIDILKTYMTCKLNISDSGLTVASQSMFGLVNGKNDFDITNVISTEDYFSQNQYIELSDTDFNYVLKEDGQSHKALIKNSVLANLKKQNITNVTITLNKVWQNQNKIVLNKSDIDIKELNLLSYKLITQI